MSDTTDYTVCEACLRLREQRAIQAEKARVIRRLKRGLPL
jgi:hypothetical protein